MSRGEAAVRLVEAAIALGTARGAGALTLQQVADAGGVSKALVLYHFGDKDRLLAAVAARLVALDVEALEAAAGAPDALDAWRQAAADGAACARRALLAALLQDPAQEAVRAALTAQRAAAATRLGQAVLAGAGLRARIPASLVGRVLLVQLDGFAAVGAHAAAAREADLDALAFALLGLGH
jgi:AcrR family transcriptional regulator